MTFKVEISEQAEKDLRGIYNYISLDLQVPDVAAKQLRRLEESIGKLDIMPERHQIYSMEPWFSRGLRVFPVDNFLVFYIPDKKSKKVTVIRVLYGGQDIVNALNRLKNE